jgi:hypothetical protein
LGNLVILAKGTGEITAPKPDRENHGTWVKPPKGLFLYGIQGQRRNSTPTGGIQDSIDVLADPAPAVLPLTDPTAMGTEGAGYFAVRFFIPPQGLMHQ